MPSLAHYMTQYDHEHESGWNKFLHGVGIPMIFAGLSFCFSQNGSWEQDFFSADGASLSRPPDRGTIQRFFRDRFICWLGQSGLQRKHDVPNGHAPQADLGRYSAKRRDEVNAAIQSSARNLKF